MRLGPVIGVAVDAVALAAVVASISVGIWGSYTMARDLTVISLCLVAGRTWVSGQLLESRVAELELDRAVREYREIEKSTEGMDGTGPRVVSSGHLSRHDIGYGKPPGGGDH